MARKKRGQVRRLPPVEIDISNPTQRRLYDHIQRLTEVGQAAEWMRAALITALPAQSKANGRVPVIHEPHYEDIED